MEIEIEISGVVTCNVTEDKFLDAFIEWLESKDWTFGGATYELDSKGKRKDNQPI